MVGVCIKPITPSLQYSITPCPGFAFVITEDCYWHHKTPAEIRFLCFNGNHTVCPRCFVEKCPVETPKWFGACTAAGHLTWSRPATLVPRKLVCLESTWDNRVF